MSTYDELVGRLERTRPVHNGLGQPIAGLVEHRNPDGPEAAAAIMALEGENFTLAAGQCLFDDGTGLTGDEGGTPVCLKDAALAEMLDAYGSWTGKTAKQERADERARQVLKRGEAR